MFFGSAVPGFLLILLLNAIVAVGCTKVGPDFSSPAVQVRDNWLETGNQKLATGYDEHREWWRVFKDPALDRLITQAYQENLTLQQAGVRVLQARAQLGIAIGGLYPQTQQGVGVLEKNRVSERGVSQGATALNYTRSKLGGEAAWELDFWGKLRRTVESADAGLEAAVAGYDSALVTLTADVANLYLTLRTLEKRLEIAHNNVETQKEALEIARFRFEGGVTSMRDVEQALTVLSSTEATIPSLEAQIRQTQNALCVLLGRPPAQLPELAPGTGVIPAPPPTVAVGIPADLLRRRPDLREAEWQAAAQCARIGVAKAELFPAFSLRGAFGFTAADVGTFSLADMFQWRSREGFGGPSFQWNILNYGRITNLVRVQDARFQELLLAYQNLVLKAQQEVEDNLIAFLKTEDRAKLLGDSTAAAARSLDLAMIQYREGMTDFTTVLTAQQNLLAQQDSLATSLGDIALSLVGVYRALGGGWHIREGQELVAPETQAAMARRTNWGKLLRPVAAPTAEPGQPRKLVRPPQW
ncbi:MAG: efflux transporter outer membrane subunit [Deltaproteobacteria bacterium]|nr:efflux transporter outer membrane subunit [Deltaproteobacteria bacterium]